MLAVKKNKIVQMSIEWILYKELHLIPVAEPRTATLSETKIYQKWKKPREIKQADKNNNE